MKTKHFLSTSILLVTILAFVYFAQPIYAKANSSDMDFVTTTMSSSEVAQLFSGAEVFVPAAIIIIGFIVMMYCTLRNIDTPIDFSGQQSFIDKCQSLGQFMINNISDDVKDFFYSVYVYCQDNNITSVTGMAVFLMKHAALFFNSIAKWIGGSVLNNPSQNAQNLIGQFINNPVLRLSSTNFLVQGTFDLYSSVAYSSAFTFAVYQYERYWSNPYNYFLFGVSPVSNINFSDYVCLFTNNGVYIGTFEGDYFVPTSDVVFRRFTDWQYAISNELNPSPNLSSYQNVSWFSDGSSYGYSYQGQSLTINRSSFYISGGDRWLQSGNIINYFYSLGFATYMIYDAVTESISSVSKSNLRGLQLDVLNPASDNSYSPTDDVVNIDIVGTYADIAAAAAAAAATGAVVTALDKIQAYVGDIGLTLSSAIPQDVVVDNAGNYHFPNLDGIWKYPRYFFDMLKGWGAFVGGCLNAVTVGEGGLSWIFYGGFIILICGGVVGKIILG